MNIHKAILVIVDLQKGFITDDTRWVVPSIVSLADRWRTEGGRTAFSQYFNYSGSEFERVLNWRQLYKSPDTDLIEQITPYSHDSTIIRKYTYSALTQDLLQLVHRLGCTDLVVCGIDTELCVLTTVFGAFDNGLTPWVVTDASASTGGPSAHEAGLLVMARGIGEQHLVIADQLFTEHRAQVC